MPEKLTSTAVNDARRLAGFQVGTTWEVRDVIKYMARIKPFMFPFTNMLFLSGAVKWRTTNNLQGLFEYPEKEMVPNKTHIDRYTSGAGTSTLVITPAEPNIFVVGTSVVINETGETGTVTASAATITIERDKSSAGATQTWTEPTPGADKYIYTLGESRYETDGIPTPVSTNPFMLQGRVQLFEKSVSATDMFVASAMNGGLYGGDWFSEDIKEKTEEMKRELEMAAWRNQGHMIENHTTKGVRTKFSGIPYQIENGGGMIHHHNGTMDKANLWAFFKMMKYGNKKKTLFAGDDVVEIIENMIEDKMLIGEPLSRYGPIKGDDIINVIRIRRFNVIVDVIRVPHFEDDWAQRAYMLDDASIFGCHFVNDKKGTRKFRTAFQVDEKGQPTETATFLSHVGFGLSNIRAHGAFIA